jgi:protein involved in polysaccharide export with SLBB domain
MRVGWRWRAAVGFAFSLFAAISTATLCLVATNCSGIDATPASPAQIQALKTAAATVPPLRAADKIHVIVYEEPSLTADYVIDPSGFVTLPLAGTIKAAGLTPNRLAMELAGKLGSKYLKNPQVTVEVVEFRPFYIGGEVQKPGAYTYIGGLNVLSAFAIAGGRTYRANRSYVLIQHENEENMHRYELNWPIPILPGDIIEVPQRYI